MRLQGSVYDKGKATLSNKAIYWLDRYIWGVILKINLISKGLILLPGKLIVNTIRNTQNWERRGEIASLEKETGTSETNQTGIEVLSFI